MIIHFCPQCGKKAEEEFNFCPYCGIKFPRDEAIEPEAVEDNEQTHQQGYRTPVKNFEDVNVQNEASCSTSTQVAQRRASTRSFPKESGDGKSVERNSAGASKTVLKRKLSSTPEKEQKKKIQASPAKLDLKSEMSPRNKKAKHVLVQPLPKGDILTDTSNNTKWVLGNLLAQEETGIYYNVHMQSKSDKEYNVLKLDAKNGKTFHEQNFFQRAAKKMTVDKWKKSHNCPALGMPNCIGFGVHDDYRFLVFSTLGQSLHTVINKMNRQMSETAVYQILYRMIDVLEYVHENEYVHGDITSENIYVNSDYREVYLSGYYNAFRYCPEGKHVEYRVSATPHEGTAEFISLDLHKGIRPTRRSDLESLGYCMLKWLCGSLPWSDETNPCSIMEHKERFRKDLPGFLKQCFNKRKIAEVSKLYLEKVMNLNYEEKPDYHEIQNYFSTVLQKAHVGPYDPVKL